MHTFQWLSVVYRGVFVGRTYISNILEDAKVHAPRPGSTGMIQVLPGPVYRQQTLHL